MTNRELQRTIEAVATSDGAGVKLRRSLGSVRGLYLDPFLMLDEFSSDDAADYISGFPSHPHRRPPATGADRPVRPVRDDHPRGGGAGCARLSQRDAHERGVMDFVVEAVKEKLARQGRGGQRTS